MTKSKETVREAVGVFSDYEKLQEAIAVLQGLGFDRRHISVLGSESSLEEAFGKSKVKAEKLEDSPKTPKNPNIAPEEVGVAQGVLVGGGMLTGIAIVAMALGLTTITGPMAILIAIGGGSGAAVGGMLAKLLGDKYAEHYQKQIDAGGAVLWILVEDKSFEKKALDTLKKYKAQDIHVHEVSVKSRQG